MVKLGIIGMGRMGITHFSILNAHPQVKITCIADTSKIILPVITKYLQDVSVYENYQDLIDKEEIDALVICTPPNLHYEITRLASERNINVFCEKPFTTSYSKANELSNLFEKKNLVNQVGYVNRFNDIFQTVKNFVEKGAIGKTIRFRSEMYSRTITKPVDGNNWRDLRENGGGALYEMASHALDLVNFIIGSPDKVTGSSLTSIHSRNVEDAVNATLLYKNGVSGILNVNWSDESYRKPSNKIEIFGTDGKIISDQYEIKIYLKRNNEEFGLHEGWNSKYITDVFKPVSFYVRGNEFTSQLYHFIDCIIEKCNTTKCTFGEASKVLELIEGILSDYNLNAKNI